MITRPLHLCASYKVTMHCDVTQGTELQKLYKTSSIVILQRNEENYYWGHLVSQSVFTLQAYTWPIQTKNASHRLAANCQQVETNQVHQVATSLV